MERYRKSVFYCTLVLLFSGILVTFQEGPTLPANEQWHYYVVRTVLFVVMAAALVPIRKNPFSQTLNIFLTGWMTIYCIHGQYYNPWYIFAFIQVKYAEAFLFPIKRKTFMIATMISTIAYVAMLIWRFEVFARWAANPVLPDIVLSVVLSMSVAVMANYFFTADRTYREDTIRRFGLIGVQSASIIHDLKGLIAAPKVYADVVAKKVENSEDPELKEISKHLSQSLERFHLIISQMNRVSAMHVAEVESFSLSEVIMEISVALSLDRKNVAIDLSYDPVLNTQKSNFKSIALNIVLNSVQSFQRKSIANPRITISRGENDSICFSDNAGGFDPEILARVENEKYLRDSVAGSGLGTFLILDNMKSLGGFARFRNSEDGAEVSLHFARKILVRNNLNEAVDG